MATLTFAGTFGVGTGDKSLGEIGLAVGDHALYAGFDSSETIATFALGSGCSLTFVGDVPVKGEVTGMKVHNNLLVVADSNGYVESFNISGSLPVSNGDAQISTAFTRFEATATGVDLSQDGHWAIFGDSMFNRSTRKSDISSGKLTPTVVYQTTTGLNSNNVLLSEEQKFLYVSQNQTSQVSAFFFNTKTGVLTNGCTTPTLTGSGELGGLALGPAKNGRNFVYAAENMTCIAALSLAAKGTSCRLTQLPGSPIRDPQAPSGLVWIGSYLR